MRVQTYNSSANLLNNTAESAPAAIGVSTVPSCQGSSCDPSSVLLVQGTPNAPNQPAHIASFILGKFVQAAAALGVITAIFAARGRNVIHTVLTKEVKGINPSSRPIANFDAALKYQSIDAAHPNGLLRVTLAHTEDAVGKTSKVLPLVDKQGKLMAFWHKGSEDKHYTVYISNNRSCISEFGKSNSHRINPKDRNIKYFMINENSEVSLPPFSWLDAFTPQQFKHALIGFSSLFTGNHKELVIKQAQLVKEPQAA